MEGIGRGEWIRTTDLLVPNQELTKIQQLSSGHSGCDALLQAPTAQSVTREMELDRNKRSQHLYAQTGHTIGHSTLPETFGFDHPGPSDKDGISGDIATRSVVQAFLDGKRPEEIHGAYPTIRLSQIYAMIALYLDQKERVASHIPAPDTANT